MKSANMRSYYYQGLSDDELVELFQGGDDYAFEELLIRYQEKITGFICANVKDHEERKDVYQDVCVKLYIKLKQPQYYKSQGKFVNWLMFFVHNATLQIYRYAHRYSILYVEDLECHIKHDGIPQELDAKIEERIQQCVNDLPEYLRLVVERHYFEGKKYTEIASETGVSINTILGRARYAKMHLSKALDNSFDY